MSQRVWCSISEQEIDQRSLVAVLDDPKNGAQVVFTGTVRLFNNGRKVQAVSYDVHDAMALKCFNEICVEAEKLTSDPLRIVICHRKGKLKVGEISIFIGVSSPHRSEAYEVSRYMIEQIKLNAPIWKKEFYEDGESDWLQGHALCQH